MILRIAIVARVNFKKNGDTPTDVYLKILDGDMGDV